MENGKTIQANCILNKCTRTISSSIAVVTGVIGIFHGIAEVLQGDRPTIDIGARIGAFSVIPNYLLTGLITLIISGLILWCGFCLIHRRIGPLLYLALSLLQFSAGGGIAIVPGFILGFITASQIRKPLVFWEKRISEKWRLRFSSMWKESIISGFCLLAVGILIWIFLTPPVKVYDISITQYICWIFLVLGFVVVLFGIIAGFSRDLIYSKIRPSLSNVNEGKLRDN
jgi:hypothetical protein